MKALAAAALLLFSPPLRGADPLKFHETVDVDNRQRVELQAPQVSLTLTKDWQPGTDAPFKPLKEIIAGAQQLVTSPELTEKTHTPAFEGLTLMPMGKWWVYDCHFSFRSKTIGIKDGETKKHIMILPDGARVTEIRHPLTDEQAKALGVPVQRH